MHWLLYHQKIADLISTFLFIYFVSDKGTVYSARAYKIPECSRAATGTPLVRVLP